MDLSPLDPARDLDEALATVRARVTRAEELSGRAGAGVRVLVATKTFDASAVRRVIGAGAKLVGENRLQELEAKADAAHDEGAKVHVIGPVQRNKVQLAVKLADCVQTVDSLRLAERLSRLCLEAERTLDVMIQVNVSGEETKSGVLPEEALALASQVQRLDGLHVIGFMTIGLNSPVEAAVRAGYAQLREIRDAALIGSERGEYPLRDAWELSMGMSNDLEWAVAEGATMVRVGTAVMGARDYA